MSSVNTAPQQIKTYEVEPLPGKPMNFAVIGCGNLAVKEHVANIAAREDLVLHTCCDVSDERLALCRDRFGAHKLSKDYRQVMADPDVEAVVIVTTAELRLPVVEAAAKAGKAVYVEKPLANTMEEVHAIGDIIKRAGVPFCIGHNRRSSPAMIDAQRIFRAHMQNPRFCPWRMDREGHPTMENDGVAAMNVRINSDWHGWKNWAHDKHVNPHGKLLTELTHFTDLTNWFLAAEPTHVTAMKFENFSASAIFKYKTGEMATIMFSNNGSRGYPKELYEVFGHGAAMAIDHMIETRIVGIPGVPHTLTYPMVNDMLPEVGREGGMAGYVAKRRALAARIAAGSDPFSVMGLCEADKGHAHAVARFAHEIRGSGPVVNGIDDAVLTTRMAFAAVRSEQEQRVVRIDEI